MICCYFITTIFCSQPNVSISLIDGISVLKENKKDNPYFLESRDCPILFGWYCSRTLGSLPCVKKEFFFVYHA
jgi:hypothetical protein